MLAFSHTHRHWLALAVVTVGIIYYIFCYLFYIILHITLTYNISYYHENIFYYKQRKTFSQPHRHRNIMSVIAISIHSLLRPNIMHPRDILRCMVTCYIVLCHIISYYIVFIIFYRILSQFIIFYRILSYFIIVYYILYHSITYYTMSFGSRVKIWYLYFTIAPLFIRLLYVLYIILNGIFVCIDVIINVIISVMTG